MNVVFRTDASITIGTGHVMRCLTLADAFRDCGLLCHFICGNHEGNLAGLIREKGYDCTLLPLPEEFSKPANNLELAHAEWLGASQEDDAAVCKSIIRELKPSWVIVDHYGIDATWEGCVAGLGAKIFVIDDLADRNHSCEILLDQTFGRSKSDYELLVPPRAEILCGAEYSLLRPEFAAWRQASLGKRNRSELKCVLVNFGGVDKDNLTCSALQALEKSGLSNETEIIVVLGGGSPHITAVVAEAGNLRFSSEVIVSTKNMAELMAGADLAIGAAGATTWERCCLGLPTLVLAIAENQQMAAQALADNNIAMLVSNSSNLVQAITSRIDVVNENRMSLLELSDNCARVTDGCGVDRVLDSIARVYYYD